MKAILVLLIFAFKFVQAAPSESYSVILYHQANPPYSFVKAQNQEGIFIDIFREISILTNLEFEFVPLSVARGKLYFEQGKVDIEPGISPTWRKNEQIKGLYSISYATSKEIILSNQVRKIEHISELYGQVIGKVRGYSYGEFDNYFGEDKLIPVGNTSEKMLVEQLYKNRFKYILIGEATAAYYIASIEKYRGFKKVFEISEDSVSMRVHPQHAHLLPILNQALRKLKNSGKIKSIYARYGYLID